MLDSYHIKELDRIFKEICNVDSNKVKWVEYGDRTKSLFHFSEPSVCTRVTITTSNVLNILILVSFSDVSTCKFSCTFNGSRRTVGSNIENDRYDSDGYSTLMYQNQNPSEISKSDYFNEMINNPDLPDYNHLLLAEEVDKLFIDNEISGELYFNISTVNLKKITFKEYW